MSWHDRKEPPVYAAGERGKEMNHPDGCNCHICVNVHGIRVDPTKLGYAGRAVAIGDVMDQIIRGASEPQGGSVTVYGAGIERALTDASREIERLRAEVNHWRGSYENEFQNSRRCMDELTAMGKRNKELTEAIEGAQTSFENIAERLGPDTVHGGCKCMPGFMCVFCEAKEATDAMAFTLENPGFFEKVEDSPAEIELARKAFGEP